MKDKYILTDAGMGLFFCSWFYSCLAIFCCYVFYVVLLRCCVFFLIPFWHFSVAEGAKYYSIKLQPLFYTLFDIFQRLSVVFSQTTFAPYFPQKKNYHISGWITSK